MHLRVDASCKKQRIVQSRTERYEVLLASDPDPDVASSIVTQTDSSMVTANFGAV
jgi:hypothetical protein